MAYYRQLRYQIILVGFCLYSPLLYAGEEPKSSIWISNSADEQDVRQQSAFMSLELNPNNTLLAQYGQTTNKTSNRDITSNQYSLALSNFNFYPTSLDIGLEYWGKDREFVTRTLSLGTHWYGEIFQFGMNYEYRHIDLYSTPTSFGQRRIEIASNGIGPTFVAAGENWSWQISSMWYDYNQSAASIRAIRTLLQYRRFVRNLAHASNIDDRYTSTSLRYTATDWSGVIILANSIATIDKAQTNSIGLGLNVDLATHYAIDMEVGRPFSEQNITSDYYNISLGYRF